MKQYKETGLGEYTIDNMTIPMDKGNRHYRQLLSEVDSGDAEIITYSIKPDANDKTNQDIRALKSEEVMDAMIDFMDGKPGKFKSFKSKLDVLKGSLK